MMTKEILRELEGATTELLQVISSFKQEEINTVPFEGSWTAAQVAEHIYKSDSALLKTLYGPVKPTERPPGQNIEKIKSEFLDFDTKMSSPKFLVPSDSTYDKETLINSLKKTRAKITEAAATLNLSETCPNSVLGEWTRLEIIHFIVYHTQRHAYQLKNIFQKIGTQPGIPQTQGGFK